jgi:ABC-type polysaccharide/polyol phosphate transport system ATPase subunit
MRDTLIKVEGVSKKFCRSLKKSLWYGMKDLGNELRGRRHGGNGELRPEEFWAVKDVSFELKRGECLGLIGRNGAGKTTLLRMLNGLVKPDQGRIEMHGRVGALIALGAGFNPILTGRENVYVNASVLGITKTELDRKLDDIVEFAEIGEFIDAPVQSYSSGMQVRLGFSVATALEPDILLLDEVLAVGDASFQSKCIKRIGSVLDNCAVIFVSHNAWSVRRICDSVIWLKSGSIAYHGDTEPGVELYGESAYVDTSPALFLNTADCITNVSHHAKLQRMPRPDGGEAIHIDITISFDSDRPLNPGFCLGNVITRDEVVVGQFDFRQWVPSIHRGRNSIEFRAADVQLARGKYFLNVVVFDETNKSLLLNLRYFSNITFEKNIRFGPHYAISTEPLADRASVKRIRYGED